MFAVYIVLILQRIPQLQTSPQQRSLVAPPPVNNLPVRSTNAEDMSADFLRNIPHQFAKEPASFDYEGTEAPRVNAFDRLLQQHRAAFNGFGGPGWGLVIITKT